MLVDVRVRQHPRPEFVAIHIKHAPAVSVVIPAGVGVRDGDVKALAAALLCGRHIGDLRWFSEGCCAAKHEECDQVFHVSQVSKFARIEKSRLCVQQDLAGV